jgi:D-alanyl-D-alanine carboxypeptidase (penicillin-binding protein 5/6)
MIGRHPDLYRRYFGQKRMMWNGVLQASHDPTVGIVPGADGIKTGHTNEAGYNFLGSAVRGGRRLVMVVAGAKSEQQRANASRALLEWGYSAWDTRKLFAAQALAGEAKVQGGDARHVGLAAPQAIFATFPKGEQPALSLRIIYKGPLKAPIAKGAEVAELEIRAGDAAPSRVPLVAATSVGKAGWLDRIVNGVMGLFA